MLDEAQLRESTFLVISVWRLLPVILGNEISLIHSLEKVIFKEQESTILCLDVVITDLGSQTSTFCCLWNPLFCSSNFLEPYSNLDILVW